jgi:exonuclease VII large subunit
MLSVSQLNDRIASVVRDMPALNGVRCIGEVTDPHQNSTALYLTLTDGDAGLPYLLWANRYREMDADPRGEDEAAAIVVVERPHRLEELVAPGVPRDECAAVGTSQI